jgi:hypothetical protein
MNYPDPCKACNRDINGSCAHYKSCPQWLARYRYRQDQINAYAKNALPAYYAAKEKEAEENG